VIGIAHEVRPANIDETMRPREAPRRHAERLAREKASAIATRDPVGAGPNGAHHHKSSRPPADAATQRMLRMLVVASTRSSLLSPSLRREAAFGNRGRRAFRRLRADRHRWESHG
jgi:hypothetical protein